MLMLHPTGNVNVRNVASALAEDGLLAEFWTTICHSTHGWIDRLAPASIREQLRRRTFPVEVERCLFQFPGRECARLLAAGLKLNWLIRHEVGWASVDAVYRSLDARVAQRIMENPQGFSGVYCYEDGALETFRTARSRGMLCVYDLPIAYWRFMHTLFCEEAKRWPAWKPTLGGTQDSALKLARKDEELSLAHAIVTPSQFVRKSLDGYAPGIPILVAEFGSPEIELDVILDVERINCIKAGKPMRVLFAGSMSQRKGLADLFAAMNILQRTDVELIVMGSPAAPMEFYRKEYPAFRYEPTRRHSEVLRLMQQCHLLVLPSIAEGRALVQQEAMSCGLPLIITPNAGGEDLILEGLTGCLIPIRSPEIIAEAITFFADRRGEWEFFSQAARKKAAMYKWQKYGQKIVEFISSTRFNCN